MAAENGGIYKNWDGLGKIIEESREKGAPQEDTTKLAYATFGRVYWECFGLPAIWQHDDTIVNQEWVNVLKLKNKETYAGLKTLVKEETDNKIKAVENTFWAKLPLLGGDYKKQQYKKLTEVCQNITRSIDDMEQFFVYGADRHYLVREAIEGFGEALDEKFG